MPEFDDGKDESALRTIGEVSEGLGIKPHVLRYWEQQFSLLEPLKRSGGRRYYRAADVDMVKAINTLVNEEGYTLKGAEAVLRSTGADGVDRREGDRRLGDRRAQSDAAQNVQPSSASAIASASREQIAALKNIRSRLARAIEA